MHGSLHAAPGRSRARGEAGAGHSVAARCAAWLLVASLVLHAAATNASAPEFAAAVRAGDLPALRALIDAGDTGPGEIDIAAPDGTTALLWAVQGDDIELVRTLLDAGADPNRSNRYDITPLWLAATNGSARLVELLLARGADAQWAMSHGETALMAAARAGAADSIRSLLAAGADPNAHETAHGETALMWAAAEDHADAIRALIAGGADPNAHSHELDLPDMAWDQTGMVSTVLPNGGWTALMYAARENAQAAVGALAEIGADLDAQEPYGMTALNLAIMNEHYDLAALLLEAGADPNVADRTGMTALYAAVDMVTQGPLIGRPRMPRQGRLDALDIVRLTLAHGADPNAPLSSPLMDRHHNFGDRELGAGATALMRAAKSADIASLRILLEAGADPAVAAADGANVPYFLAAANLRDDATASGAADVLRLALERGADPAAAAGRAAETALHRAARRGHAAMVAILVEHGAPLDARDRAGLTPFDIVAEGGAAPNDAIAAILSGGVGSQP